MATGVNLPGFTIGIICRLNSLEDLPQRLGRLARTDSSMGAAYVLYTGHEMTSSSPKAARLKPSTSLAVSTANWRGYFWCLLATPLRRAWSCILVPSAAPVTGTCVTKCCKNTRRIQRACMNGWSALRGVQSLPSLTMTRGIKTQPWEQRDASLYCASISLRSESIGGRLMLAMTMLLLCLN